MNGNLWGIRLFLVVVGSRVLENTFYGIILGGDSKIQRSQEFKVYQILR